jgi:hypothetical protein
MNIKEKMAIILKNKKDNSSNTLSSKRVDLINELNAAKKQGDKIEVLSKHIVLLYGIIDDLIKES